jgi:putative acetyltransferase
MSFSIRKILPVDSPGMKQVIQTVMPEFGASGPGFAIHDPEVQDMFSAYQNPRHIYFVVECEGRILGGGGIAPLEGNGEEICELRKMYFMPELRGKGIGLQVMDLCLKAAKNFGFKQCYLETLDSMKGARKLYEKNGFKKIPCSMGQTGHFGCDTFYLKEL